MTTTSERAFDEREKYHNNNPDPHYRPAVSRLVMKLRGLPLLQEPHVAEYVIDDLIYHFFRAQGRKRPHSLYRLLNRIHSYWSSALAFTAEQNDNDRQNYFTEFAISSDDAPEKVSLPPGATIVHFESKGLKASSSQTVLDHSYTPLEKKGIEVPACACGKEFEFIEQWATHARLRIWKGLGYEPIVRASRESSPHG